MIKAKDLRIGNWVNEESKVHGEIIQELTSVEVDVKLLYDLVTNNTGSYNYEPIQLTIDRLLKCGFHKLNNAWVPKNYDVKNYNHWYFTIWDAFDGADLRYNSAEFNIELKYLHQLQNLFFCLTGKELEVNNFLP